MKAPLVRFGVAMERPLLSALDELVKARKTTRSKILSDLARAEVNDSLSGMPDTDVVVALTLVYDHHVPELSEKLTSMQHELGNQVRATLHIHLSHDECLEVVVMQGRRSRLHRAAKTLLATRGVTHGGVETFADGGWDDKTNSAARQGRTATSRARRHAHGRHSHT